MQILETIGQKHTKCYSEGRKRGVVLKQIYPQMYNSWRAMKGRCNNPNQWDYKYYGGKGIKVDRCWHTFKQFSIWSIANGYKTGLTIDRFDTNKNYTPDNCQWITLSENVAKNNRERSKRKTNDR